MIVGIGIGFGIKLGVAIKGLLAAGAVVAVVSIACWEWVKAWLTRREDVILADPDHLAFSFMEKLKSGRYRTVCGIFNQRTGSIVDAEAVESYSVDDTLRSYHKRDPLVVYR